MKTIAAIFFFFSFIASLAAQQIDVPDTVAKTLAKLYPEAKTVTWDLSEEGEYIATFALGQKEISARFSSSAEWLGSIFYLEQTDLPVAIHRSVATHFPEFEMYDVTRVELPSKESFYEVILESEFEALYVRYTVGGEILLKENIQLELD